jgi:flagellar hook-associated protein 2
MPDFNLPGISSNIDVKGIIDRLMETESRKLDRLEDQKEFFDKEKSAWSTLGSKVSALEESARALHGFRSPFRDKLAHSSDEDIITATASRTAEPSTSSIKVIQKATNERIISDPVSNERIFEPGLIKIRIGDRELEINFRGGRIEDLARAINEQAGDHVRAKITGNTPETSVLVLETVQTGAKNRIEVTDGPTLQLFKDMGLFEEARAQVLRPDITGETVQNVSGTGMEVSDGVLKLEPQTSARLYLDRPVQSSENMLLKVQVRAEGLPETPPAEPAAFPELRGIGNVTVEDIEIEGQNQVSSIEEKPEEPAERPDPVIDHRVIGLGQVDGSASLVEVRDLGADFKEYTYRFNQLAPQGSAVDSVVFSNESTGRKVEYRDLSVVDTEQRTGAVPKNQVQEAQDAVVMIDGVRVQRESNRIEDALKGVTLDVRSAGDREVTLSVDYDYEKITGSIVSLVEKYNELLGYINQQTKVVPGTSPEERAEAGLLTGDIAVMGLKNKLQRIMMNPYPTDRGQELSLLAQIGISMGPLRASVDEIRGGLLKVDEETFISAFEQYPDSIKQLFGADTDNDALVDSGVAYTLEQTLGGYTEPRNGVIAYRVKSMENKISSQDRKIDDFNEHLVEYRQRLEEDFTLMQQSMGELEQTQRRLQNFSTQYGSE